MQIVIDIPEDTYKRTKFYKEFRDLNDCVLVLKAIDRAIELPKGHGRLIDADALRNEMDNDIRKALSFVDLKDFVWLAPTIIEADRSDKE